MTKIKYKDFFLEADQHKIYVKKGQQAPEGKKIQTGPRGGQFFVGTAKEKEEFGKSNKEKDKYFKQVGAEIDKEDDKKYDPTLDPDYQDQEKEFEKTTPSPAQIHALLYGDKKSSDKKLKTKKINMKDSKEVKSTIEDAFKNLNIENDELEGWTDEGDGYFIKGEFDKGVKIFNRGNEWYIATEDSEGYTDKEKKLPNDSNKIKDMIEDYNFDVAHPDDDE
jgi:hypothetical protein